MRGAVVLALLIAPLVHGTSPARATFPGANGRIAVNAIDTGNYDIYTINPDGSGRTNLTNHPADDLNPAWSPDGRRIAFTSNRSGVFAQYVMAADGSSVTHVTDGGGWPTWSPTGQQIAFVNGGLFVVNVDGSGLTQIASGSALTPAWSPSGTEIAFSRYLPSGDAAIYIIHPDGTGLRPVTGLAGAVDQAPNWAPDGDSILFTRFGSGAGIYEVGADGTGQELVMQPSSGALMAVYSPNGRRIAYTSGGALFVTRALRDDLQLGAGDKPDWQPTCVVGGRLGSPLGNCD